MNVEIRAEAAQFPEKEYINGIAFAVQENFFSTGFSIKPFQFNHSQQATYVIRVLVDPA
jgi:hypothetical protein